MDLRSNETDSTEFQKLSIHDSLTSLGTPKLYGYRALGETRVPVEGVAKCDLFHDLAAKPEFRRHYRLCFRTRVKLLSEAISPYEMLEGCDHAMLGTLNEISIFWLT